MKRALVLTTFVLSLDLGCAKRHGPDVAKLVGEARKLGDQRDQERRAALAKIPPVVVPRPDLGACPVASFKPDPYEPTDASAMSDTIMDDIFLVERAGVVTASEAATKPGPARQLLEIDLRNLEGKDGADDVERARKLTQPSSWDPDLTLIVDEVELPERLDDKTFRAGMLRGRAYVWDFAQSAIVCAAMIRVESSERVRFALTDGASKPDADAEYLRGDLYSQGIAEAKRSLLVAGPRLP